MCDKVIIENDGMLGFIPDSHKDQKVCDKAVNYSHELEYFFIIIYSNYVL